MHRIRARSMTRTAGRAGFVGLTEFGFWRSGALLALNTFAAHLLSALSLPLLFLLPRAGGSGAQVPSEGAHGGQAHSEVAWSFSTCRHLVCCCSAHALASVGRRHRQWAL